MAKAPKRARKPSNGKGDMEQRGDKLQVKAKVYTLDGQPIHEEVDVVEGMVQIFTHKTEVLINPGSSPSFLSMNFTPHIPTLSIEMYYQLIVSTRMGHSKMTEAVYPECHIYVGGVSLLGDLIAIEFEGYDVT